MFGIQAERLPDVSSPDLPPNVIAEVEFGPQLRPGFLAILGDQDERGEKDRLEAHDHGEQTKRKGVEFQSPSQCSQVDGDPQREPQDVDVDERNRPGETADGVGHSVLSVHDAAPEPVFGPGIRGKAPIELAVLYAISPVYGAASLTGLRMS
jgi:hypothetical protein